MVHPFHPFGVLRRRPFGAAFDSIRHIVSPDSRVFVVLSEVLGEPVDGATASRRLEEFANWDSLTHATLLLALEEEFQVQLAPDDLTSEMEVSAVATLVGSERP